MWCLGWDAGTERGRSWENWYMNYTLAKLTKASKTFESQPPGMMN